MGELQLVKLWIAQKQESPFAAYELYGPVSDASASQEVRDLLAKQKQRGRGWTNSRGAFVTASMAPIYCGLGYRKKAQLRSQFEIDVGVRPKMDFLNDAMQYGIDQEENFLRAYGRQVCPAKYVSAFEASLDSERRVGLVVCPEAGLGYFAASPDGLVGPDGVVEIKVSANYQPVRFLEDSWLVQVQMIMACTKRKWCDIASCYRPRDDAGGGDDASEMWLWRVKYSPEYVKRVMNRCTEYVKTVLETRKNAPARAEPTIYAMPPIEPRDMLIYNQRLVKKALSTVIT